MRHVLGAKHVSDYRVGVTFYDGSYGVEIYLALSDSN